MKTSWKQTTLGSACSIQSGAGFPEKHQGQKAGDYPFYKVSDMNLPGNEKVLAVANNYISETTRRELRASIFPAGSIVFPKVGGAIATNKKRRISRPSCVDNNVMGLIPDTKEVDEFFLAYLMDGIDIYEFSNKSNPPSIRQGTVAEWPVTLPPLTEQQRIVRVLDEAFEGTATARANAEKNLRNARAVFESYVQSVFNDAAASSGTKRLDELADFKNGLNFSQSSKGQIVEIVGVGDFQENDVVPLGSLASITIDGELADGYELREGDLLTVRSNGSKDLVGRCMILPELDGILSYSGFLIRIRPNMKLVVPRFLMYFMKIGATRNRLTRDGGGANISNLNQGKLSALEVPVPSLSEQRSLVEKLDRVREETQALEAIASKKVVAFDALKQSLLREAFSGRL